MKRGEAWWVDFGPARCGEIRKTQPAVIVRNDVANAKLNKIQVLPLTSNSGRLYTSEAQVSVAGQMSKTIANQIAPVDK